MLVDAVEKLGPTSFVYGDIGSAGEKARIVVEFRDQRPEACDNVQTNTDKNRFMLIDDGQRVR